MLTGNLIISGLFILLGIGICINSYFLDLGTLARPNAGLLPFGIGILLILCSLILFFNYLLPIINNRQTDNTKVWPNVNFRKVLFVLLCLLMYMTLLGELGFLPTAFIVQLLLFKVVGSQKWLSSLIQSFITIAFVYLVFIFLLDVYIPLFPEWIY
jgi:hypothetical protein